MPESKPKLFKTLVLGIKGKCPACGQGVLFSGWSQLRKDCEVCHFQFEENAGDTWGFMYISTAFLTGLIILLMFAWKPTHLWMGRLGIFVVVGTILVMTIPHRKGIAVSLDYLTRSI